MAQYFQIHPLNPQLRLIRRAAEMVRDDALIIYPTDSSYALGCKMDAKDAVARIRRIRQVGVEHNFTLLCRDLSEVDTYAKFDNQIYRLLKSHTPGPYTFILPATREVPRRLQNPKRRTIGVRIPDCSITQALIETLGEPLMSSSLILPGQDWPENDPDIIRERLEHDVDLIIDGGLGGIEPTTVVVFHDGFPEVVRRGKGDVSSFL